MGWPIPVDLTIPFFLNTSTSGGGITPSYIVPSANVEIAGVGELPVVSGTRDVMVAGTLSIYVNLNQIASGGAVLLWIEKNNSGAAISGSTLTINPGNAGAQSVTFNTGSTGV